MILLLFLSLSLTGEEGVRTLASIKHAYTQVFLIQSVSHNGNYYINVKNINNRHTKFYNSGLRIKSENFEDQADEIKETFYEHLTINFKVTVS